MKLKSSLTLATEFFFEHAGWSYDPATETKSNGRRRCAKALAVAEAAGKAAGFDYIWERDDQTNREFTTEGPEYYLWTVRVVDDEGRRVGALCGIDFGQHGTPRTEDYARVVQAELALEALA